MTTLYTHGRYEVRDNLIQLRYDVVKVQGPIVIPHSDYPRTASGLLLAKACADLQAQLEKGIFR